MRLRWTLACLIVLFGQFYSFGQITVDFSASNTTGCGTVNAQFTNQSVTTNGSIVSSSWDFEGSSSTAENPGHFFTVPGSYTICLTVTDNTGAEETLCKDDYIIVNALPSPDFTIDPAAGCNPLTVNFQDNSTSSGNLNEWIWGLGGTSGVVINSDDSEVSSTYDLSGNYTISLTVQDEFGCSNTITKSNIVSVEDPPIIDVSSDNIFSCFPPLQSSFVNNNIQPGVTYNWDFGNGVTFTGATPPDITFTQSGAYTITVEAVTSGGCVSETILEDYINIGAPASFTFTPDSGCEDLSVTFDDTSPFAADSVWWSFGDGTSSTEFEPTHVYESQGCFSVSLIRYSNGGCITSVNSSSCIQVYAQPDLNIGIDKPFACELPHTVQFNANQAGITAWEWDFGDGATSTESSPSHTYTELGTYPVSLTVTNLFGCTNTLTGDEIVVFDFNSEVVADNSFGCTPLTVNLSSTNNSLVPVTDWDWTLINDGSSPAIEIFGTGENPNLMLVDTGLYDIRLITTNQLGCKDTVIYQDEAGVGIPPVVSFSSSLDTSCVKDDISFFDNSSSFANEWNWNFGDGGSSQEQNPDYEYLGIGPYDVTLEVIHHGCPNELTEEDFIFVNYPLAGFTVETSCIDYFNITINNSAVGATSVFYDFGIEGTDTDTSSVPNAQFTYPNEGIYLITQIVDNDTTGCADTLRREVTIGIPEAQISFSPTTGCAPLTVQIVDNSNFAAEYSYELLNGQQAVISDSTTTDPSILFTEPGLYSGIKLFIADVNGCQDSITLFDSIYVNAVTPNFGIAPNAGCRPLDVALIDSSSSLFGTIDQWEWSIPESLTGTLTDQNPNYTAPENGTFDVSLTVTDDWGCTDTMLVEDALYVTFPTAEFSADTLGCTQSTVEFTSLSLGDELDYLWNFGDGNTSTVKNPSHTYGTEGTYTVCLTVVDVNGCQHDLCKTDYVVIANPIALFVPDETYAACPPLLVNFTNHSLNANSYEWNFGDASGNSVQNDPAHIYTNPGNYSVTVIAISTFKCQDTLILEDVIGIEGPVGSFQFDKDSVCLPSAVTFTAESIEAYNYFWDFGNGTIDSTMNVAEDSFAFSYSEGGSYVPKLILEDQAGCNITIESPDTITTASLEVNFVALDTALCEGEMGTTFINASISSIPITYREWTFEGGDPATSFFDNVAVDYTGTGGFDVELIVGNGICLDTLFRDDYIGIGSNPVADFSFTPSSGCTPLTVQFTDLSTVENSTIANWDWDFVDAGTSNEQNPQEIFISNTSSIQQVELTVTSALGCTQTMEAGIPTLPLPEASIEQVPSICMGESVVLNPVITSDTINMTYSWSGGSSLSCTNCLNPVVTPMDTTEFELVLVNNFGCETIVTTTVNVLPKQAPIITLTPDTTICYNSLIQIQAGGGDFLGAYQWDVNSSGLSCYSDCFNPVASPEENTTYYLTVTNSNGCSSMDSVAVDVINDFAPFAGDDRVICPGDSVQLNLAYGDNPTWIEASGLTCASCPDPIAYPNADINYIVEAYTSIGCKIIDTVRVDVMTDADFTAGEDQMICGGESLTLAGLSEGGTPTWSPANSLSSAGEWQPTASPTVTTPFVLTVERDLCVMTDTVLIEVVNETEIWGRDTTICAGDEVVLEVFGEADSYTWKASEFLSDLTGNINVAYPEETTTFVVIGKKATCSEDTASFTVVINELPDIKTDKQRYYIPGEFIELSVEPTAENTNPLSYEWSPATGLSCRTCMTPTVSPEEDIVYTLTAIDSIYGCVTEREVSVIELEYCPEELFAVPNVFSPNGDGNNDVLELKLSPTVREMRSFRIFNRWGAVVFETDDRFDAWDGRLNGRVLNSGVYIYVLEAVCPLTGEVIMKRGDITILR